MPLRERRLGGTPDFAENRPVAATPSEPHPVHALSGWRAFVLWPLGLIMRLWGMTLRFEASPKDQAALEKNDEPIAMILWHNRLFLAAEFFRIYRQGRPCFALVSASADGAWLASFFGLVGLQTVRGSSSQRGREAALALVEVLRAGHDVGITPDGPRGPMYVFKPGALIVSRRAKVPVLLLGFELESAWQLSSWDRFRLPQPFSRVRMRGTLVPLAEQLGQDNPVAGIEALLAALNPDAPQERPAVV
jgi:lysophospholipid acyltransferase (LPLAT)-like uncharacterized protein